MRFGLFFELQLPRPWARDREQQLYKDALEEVILADRLGFDYAWFVEHHFLEEYSHSSAPEIFLAAASQGTTNVRLGHSVVQLNSTINHPVRIAERISTLDILSGGRVDFGIGEPSSSVELGGFGLNRTETRAASEDAVDAITRMFVEEPFAGWNSRYLDMPPRNVIPKPLQKPHPPLWVACSRREKIHYAAQRGAGALSFGFLEPEFATRLIKDYYRTIESETCVPMGFSVNPNVAVVVPMYCHRSEEIAVTRGWRELKFFSYANNHYYGPMQHYPAATDIYSSFEDEYKATEGDETLEANSGTLVSRGAIGTPEQVVDVVERYASVGVDQMMFLIQAGRINHEEICESLELFAREVLPRFCGGRSEQEQAKAERLAPIIEAALNRRAPMRKADPDYVVDLV